MDVIRSRSKLDRNWGMRRCRSILPKEIVVQICCLVQGMYVMERLESKFRRLDMRGESVWIAIVPKHRWNAKYNKSIVRLAVQVGGPKQIWSVPETIKSDGSFILSLLSIGTRESFSHKNCFEILNRHRCENCERNGILFYITPTLAKNKAFALQVVGLDGSLLQYFSSEIRDNDEVVRVSVQQWGFALVYASSRLRGQLQIVREAMKSFPRIFRVAPIQLREDPALALEALGYCKTLRETQEVVASIPNSLWEDRSFVALSISEHLSNEYLAQVIRKRQIFTTLCQEPRTILVGSEKSTGST